MTWRSASDLCPTEQYISDLIREQKGPLKVTFRKEVTSSTLSSGDVMDEGWAQGESQGIRGQEGSGKVTAGVQLRNH